MSSKTLSFFDRGILSQAAADAFRKLHPKAQLKNPVMFVLNYSDGLKGAAMIGLGKRSIFSSRSR